jgi:phenylalanine-4-hydroxylase
LTEWELVPVTGFLKGSTFFSCLAERKFPCTIKIRDIKNLDYTPAPDIFHDVFGHVPLLTNQFYADFLQKFGEISASVTDPIRAKQLATLFWFTVEFGLMKTSAGIKVYGSGLVSSQGDCTNAFSNNVMRFPLELVVAMNQPYDFDAMQPVLFITESFPQLFNLISFLEL